MTSNGLMKKRFALLEKTVIEHFFAGGGIAVPAYHCRKLGAGWHKVFFRLRSVRMYCVQSLTDRPIAPKYSESLPNQKEIMSNATIWWMLAGSAIAVELMTGTFYLLMLAVGLAAGALAAYLGLALVGQMLIAAAFGGGALAAWHWHRSKKPAPIRANANPDVHLDIGESVHVVRWNTDGTASVHFRGAHWTAIAADSTVAASPGNFRIKEMLGNRLVIEKL